MGGLTQPDTGKDKRLKQEKKKGGDKKNILAWLGASAFRIFVPAYHMAPSASLHFLLSSAFAIGEGFILFISLNTS